MGVQLKVETWTPYIYKSFGHISTATAPYKYINFGVIYKRLWGPERCVETAKYIDIQPKNLNIIVVGTKFKYYTSY